MTKVEPPNWWIGHSLNPVRVLMRGENLRGVALRSKLRTSNVRYSDSGTYLFADVNLPRAPGSYPFTVGSAQVPFEVLAPLERKGRFQGFGSEDVMYLIMPDRFVNGDPSNDNPAKSPGMTDLKNPRRYHGGDLQGVIGKLDYLRDLGITAIWLNPIYDNNDRASDYHGYGAVDFYAVDEHLGDVATFRALVDQAHAIGIRIVQDQVANHTGPAHPWVAAPPTPTWFNGTVSQHLRNPFQMWTLTDPYATPAMREPTLKGWFVNRLPDLNQEDPEVRRYLIQNSLWWIGMTGIDGIRQDTWPYVDLPFWADWLRAIKREYPRFKIVGEAWDNNPAVVSFFQRDGLDTLFDFPLYNAVRNVFAGGKPIRELPLILAQDRLYRDPSPLLTFLGLHDVKRFMSETGASVDSLKLAFTFLLTTRGMPLIYYGDEVGMEGGDDPDNRRAFPVSVAPDQAAVREHIRKLLRIRKKIRGPVQNLWVGANEYVYRRGNTLIVLNNGPATEIRFSLESVVSARDELGSSASLRIGQGQAVVQIGSRTGGVFLLR